MPPYDFWLRGPVEMGRWFLGQGCGCRGSRLVATAASGCAGFGSYRPDPHGGHHNFLDTDLFARSASRPPRGVVRMPRRRGTISPHTLSLRRTGP
jgi:hypothetical protein